MRKKFSLGDGNIILFPYAINRASLYFSNIFYFICRNLCPNGTYSLGAQIKCTICLPGSKCPSITEGPTICPPGYFSETNAAECKLCEAGKQCADPAGEFLFSSFIKLCEMSGVFFSQASIVMRFLVFSSKK